MHPTFIVPVAVLVLGATSNSVPLIGDVVNIQIDAEFNQKL